MKIQQESHTKYRRVLHALIRNDRPIIVDGVKYKEKELLNRMLNDYSIVLDDASMVEHVSRLSLWGEEDVPYF